MKEVLIVNLTRMGDLVQTTPVMAGLKEEHPGVRISLLANSAFSEICSHIPHIDRVFVFDIDEAVSFLRREDLVESFRYMAALLDEVNDTVYDLVINFTHSTSSAVLSSLIRTREVRGLTIDQQGFTIKRHPWIRYFFNVLPGRDINPFHLCDIYQKAGGISPGGRGLELSLPVHADDLAASMLAGEGVGDEDILVGLQLGASAEDKRWPVASFAALADRLSASSGARILLTGSAREADFGREFEGLSRVEVLNMIGRTDLSGLVALLKRCDLFISNDTGPLHIATAVGTKSINISLASVHFRETGPYGEGHYVVRAELPCCPCGFDSDCADTLCKRVITPANVAELAESLLLHGDLGAIEDSPLWENVQVYRSCFGEDGFIDYVPLISGRPLNKSLLFTEIYRQTWPCILDGERSWRADEAWCRLLERLSERYDLGPVDIPASIEEELLALKRLEGLLAGALSIVSIVAKEAGKDSPDFGLIKKLWEGVPPVDREIETVGLTLPALRPMSTIFRYDKEELEDEDVRLLSEKAGRIYGDLARHVSMIVRVLESAAAGLAERGVCTK